MEPVYLYVPPEEYAAVEASGGTWDADSKRWYIHGGVEPDGFARWLGDAEDECEFSVSCDQALIATAGVPCQSCRKSIDVICIYCESGTDTATGEPMANCALSNVSGMDEALASQLAAWSFYRRAPGTESEEGNFANHCPHCGAMLEDDVLHAEPGDVFFGLSCTNPGSVVFTPLRGSFQLSGDWSFEVA